MTKTRTYKPQLKAQVVLQVLTGAKSAAQICRDRQINENLLRRWKQQFVTHAALLFERESAAQEKDAHIADLERMVGRLPLELEVAKKVSTFVASPASKNGRLSATYPISLLCAVLGLARSSFYYKEGTLDETALEQAIEKVAARFPTYGTRRVTHQVRREEPDLRPLNRKRVQRMMREKKLLVQRKKRTPKTTNSNHAFPRFPNLVATLPIRFPNQVWVSDITYIKLGSGSFLYLAVILDVFSARPSRLGPLARLGRRTLPRGFAPSFVRRLSPDSSFGSRRAICGHRICRTFGPEKHPNFDGRSGPVATKRLCRTGHSHQQRRRSLFERLSIL